MRSRIVCLTGLLAAFVTLSASAEVMPAGLRLGIAMVADEVAGVRITQVYERSPAESIGLRVDHVIHAIDGILFDDPKLVRQHVLGKKGDRIDIVYQQGREFVQVKAKLVTRIEDVTEYVKGAPGEPLRILTNRMTVTTWQVESRQRVPNPRGK